MNNTVTDKITLENVIREAARTYPNYGKIKQVFYYGLILDKVSRHAAEKQRRETAAEKLRLLGLLAINPGQNN